MARKVSHAYVQGLTWVLTYYIHGNTPVPITNAHMDAMTEAQERLQGKGNSASDSSEGLGAAWDWSVDTNPESHCVTIGDFQRICLSNVSFSNTFSWLTQLIGS